jgi:hypothetical protein
VFLHRYLPSGVVLEQLFQSLDVVATGGAVAVASLSASAGCSFSFFSSFVCRDWV